MSEDKFAGWRTSSYSGDGNSCVEVASRRDGASPAVGVRDTKRHGRGPVLEFSAAAWQEFLGRIRLFAGRLLSGRAASASRRTCDHRSANQ
jgi:Domain of unknown function (DUF397)